MTILGESEAKYYLFFTFQSSWYFEAKSGADTKLASNIPDRIISYGTSKIKSKWQYTIYMFRHSAHGFTMTEVLIVIALIAVLSVASIVGYRLQLAKGFDTVRKQDIDTLKIAFEHYYSDHLCYPTTEILTDCGGAELRPYLQKIPCDPESREPYTIIIDTPVCAQKFFLYAELTNENDPDAVCNDRYGGASGNASVAEIDARCLGQNFCVNGYWGCLQGQCTLISAVTKPSCSPLFCTSNCQDSCGLPGWELYPQPCSY